MSESGISLETNEVADEVAHDFEENSGDRPEFHYSVKFKEPVNLDVRIFVADFPSKTTYVIRKQLSCYLRGQDSLLQLLEAVRVKVAVLTQHADNLRRRSSDDLY